MHIHIVTDIHVSKPLKCDICKKYYALYRISVNSSDGKTLDSADICEQCVQRGNNILEVTIPNPLVQRALKIRRKQITIGEKKTAAEIGGRRTPGSGSGVIKGDAVNQDWMIEEKSTDNKSYRLTKDTIDKLFSQAAGQKKKPAMRLRMRGAGYDLAVMRWSTALSFIRTSDD